MFHSWKFAADAVWEEAFSVDALQSIDIEAVEQWVALNPQNIALEAIFAKDGIPATMFGIRITCLQKAEQVSRIGRLLSRTDAISTEADFRKTAQEVFPEFALFATEPDALNIGIVGQWYSFGPERLWDGQTAVPLSCDKLKDVAPRFFETTKNPAAIEFWYTQPTDHWYKIYVSDRNANGYFINHNKYNSVISNTILLAG